MMKNSLEDFISRNREAFDKKVPPPHVWQNISAKLKAGNRAAWRDSLLLWRVAATLLLGLSVFLLVQRNTTEDGQVSSRVRNEFLDIESYYRQEIARKVALINNFDDVIEKERFVQDFQKLEAMYQVLRDELQNRPSEKVKDALILNILVRLDLLNQQIKALEDAQAEPPEGVASI